MMKKIEELEKQTKGTSKEDKVKKLGAQVDALLEKVSKVNGKVQEGETFNEAMTAMNKQFIAKRDPKLGPLKKVVEYASAAKEVMDLGKDILELVHALA
jgi:molybdopterin converting factor small subunit